MKTACTLKYLVTGIANAGATHTQMDVCEEIQEMLSHPGPVSVRLNGDGLEITISVTDIEPFSKDNFESYVYEQILSHSILACCEMQGDKFEFKLLSSSFD